MVKKRVRAIYTNLKKLGLSTRKRVLYNDGKGHFVVSKGIKKYLFMNR